MKGPKTVGERATTARSYSPSTEKKPSYSQLFKLVAMFCEKEQLGRAPANRAEASRLIDALKV